MIYAIQRKHLVGLAFILIVGAVLRFSNLDSSEFWYDEATLSTLAQNMAAGKALPLLGITSSARIPNPPTSVYLLAIPYFVSKNPLVAVGFVVLLNVIGIGLLWLIAQRYFGPLVAFVGGLLYAVSPWAVIYGRKIWAQDMHTPLILASFLLALCGFVEGKRWAQVVCLPILVFAMQVHFAAWTLLPAYLCLLWIGRKRLSRSALAVSIVLALLTLVPFMIGIMQAKITRDFGGDGIGLTLLPLQQIAWLATGLGLGEHFVFPTGIELVSQYPVIGIVWLLMIPLIGIGLLNSWRKSRKYAFFLLLWGFITPLSLVTGLYMTQPHYFIPSIPVYCLLAGLGVSWLLLQENNWKSLGRWVTIVLLSFITLTQILDWRSFLSFADTNYIYAPGFMNNSYATPLHDYLDIRSRVSKDVIMIAGSIGQALPDLWSPLLYGQVDCLRELTVADGGIAILPDHPFSLLRAPNATPYEFADMYHSAQQIRFPLREGEGGYVLDQIETPPVWTGPELMPIQPASFDNGAVLKGYRFTGGRLYLDWSLTRQGVPDYKYFVHLLNANGDKLIQHDPSFYPGKSWCTGDRIITFIPLIPPQGTVTLRIGMYRYVNGKIIGSNAYNDAGNDAPWVDIALTAK